MRCHLSMQDSSHQTSPQIFFSWFLQNVICHSWDDSHHVLILIYSIDVLQKESYRVLLPISFALFLLTKVDRFVLQSCLYSKELAHDVLPHSSLEFLLSIFPPFLYSKEISHTCDSSHHIAPAIFSVWFPLSVDVFFHPSALQWFLSTISTPETTNYPIQKCERDEHPNEEWKVSYHEVSHWLSIRGQVNYEMSQNRRRCVSGDVVNVDEERVTDDENEPDEDNIWM